MTSEGRGRSQLAERRSGWTTVARAGWLGTYVGDDSVLEIGVEPPCDEEVSYASVVAAFRLQDVADYRTTLRDWFKSVRPGGYLVVAVPHAFLHERQLALPSPWEPLQRRLYTPRSLLEEVEEALAPNSYRVRYLSDHDDGFDYSAPCEEIPAGESDIVLVLEKIELPSWQPAVVRVPDSMAEHRKTAPDYRFEVSRTRAEVTETASPRRILILKLDHMGDFIIALGALERARALFSEAEITLVVGSWNFDAACGLGAFDHVVAFDVFPRNSSEEEVDTAGKAALFSAKITREYDLAIDMRSDPDTRFLLRLVQAKLRAGIGTRAQFPFLDIFLPLDFTRNEPETAREYRLTHHDFASQGSAVRAMHRVSSRAETVERECAVIWGPYWRLRPGRYIFEPYVELAPNAGGLMAVDIALDAISHTSHFIRGPDVPRLHFEVTNPNQEFEFRVLTVPDMPAIDFSFYGGRLIREGAASVLHQAEYPALLLELVTMRLARIGLLRDLAIQGAG